MADPRAVESAVELRPPHSLGESLQLQLFSHLQVTHPGVCVFPTPQLCLSFPPRPRAGARLPVGRGSYGSKLQDCSGLGTGVGPPTGGQARAQGFLS